MNPSRKDIERWSEVTDDGWVKIPQSAWHGLLWCIAQAEKLEDEVQPLGSAAADLIEAHKRRAKNAQGWTSAEESALAVMTVSVERLKP